MLTTITFEDMERDIRDMLSRALAGTSFDAARYRGDHLQLLEPRLRARIYAALGCVLAGWAPPPIEAARQGWGRIAIANSTLGAYCLCALGDRPGRAGGGRAAGRWRGHRLLDSSSGPPVEKLDLVE